MYAHQEIVYKYVDTPYQSVIAQIGFLAEKYLRYLPREIPEFPSHGPDHSSSLIQIINDFVSNWDNDLSEEEIFLLYVSAWVHDIGCLVSREDHQKKSVELIDKHEMFKQLLGQNLYTCLKYVVKYHSSHERIVEVPSEWGGIHLQKLCSIFRILDACEICETKCPNEVYTVVMSSDRPFGAEANSYWKAHMNIQSLKFESPKIKIYVDDLTECKILTGKLEEEILGVKDYLHGIPCPIVEVIQINDEAFS